jgi:hypothetical protein
MIRVLAACLDKLCDVNHSFTMCGDFSLPNIEWSRDHIRHYCLRIFASLIIDNGLYQLLFIDRLIYLHHTLIHYTKNTIQ